MSVEQRQAEDEIKEIIKRLQEAGVEIEYRTDLAIGHLNMHGRFIEKGLQTQMLRFIRGIEMGFFESAKHREIGKALEFIAARVAWVRIGRGCKGGMEIHALHPAGEIHDWRPNVYEAILCCKTWLRDLPPIVAPSPFVEEGAEVTG